MPATEVRRSASTRMRPPSRAGSASAEPFSGARLERLADRLEHHVGLDLEGLAGADHATALVLRALELDGADVPVIASEDAHRPCPVANDDAARLRELLLVLRGVHVRLAAPVDHRDLVGPEELRLHRRVDGRHAAADHDHAAADGKRREVFRLAQRGDPADGVLDAGQVLALDGERVDGGQAHAEEHRVEVPPEVGELDRLSEPAARLDRDAADRENEVELGLREPVDGLVGGDAVFVEAAGLVAAVEDGDVVAVHGKAVGAGDSRGSRSHDGDPPAGRRGAAEGLRAGLHEPVRGVALQLADADGLVLGEVAHAGLLAKRLDGADAGAHAAEDVVGEDRLRRALRVVRHDLADEERDVDRGRARLGARRVEAEIAPVGLDEGLVRREPRVKVREIPQIRLGRQPARGDVGSADGPDRRHRLSSSTSRAAPAGGVPCPVQRSFGPVGLMTHTRVSKPGFTARSNIRQASTS